MVRTSKAIVPARIEGRNEAQSGFGQMSWKGA